MGIYVNEAGYLAYFANVVTSAPTDFDYKEQISADLFRKECPQVIPTKAEYDDTGTYYREQFDAALYEQIKYFVDNPNLENPTTDTTEFKILGYSEKADKFDSSDQKKRMSPNGWLKLSTINLTYRAVPTYV